MTPKKPLTEAELAGVRAMVIYEDDSVLVLNKPAGLSSQGARGGVNALEDRLVAFARSNGKRPHLVHRLDRDTSGVILAAKTKPAAAFLGKQIAARRMKKVYLALVAPGAPDPASGTIEAALRRVEQGKEVYMRVCEADHADAQPSTSKYRTLSASDQADASAKGAHGASGTSASGGCALWRGFAAGRRFYPAPDAAREGTQFSASRRQGAKNRSPGS